MDYSEMLRELNDDMEQRDLFMLKDYLYYLYDKANAFTFRFDKGKYKWILGIDVIHKLLSLNKEGFYIQDYNKPSTLFDIVVERDYSNPDRIELWENITDKEF
jgi:hypothetical protein